MNASCLDEKGRFKSCPYRVYTDEHKAVHNIYLCTGYERMVANGNENSE